MARVMLNSKKLSTRLWAEAVNTSYYTINRVFLRQDTNKTSYEIWKDKKPNFSHFHVFGCTCYILNDREQLGKFQAKSDKSVFLGYSINSRAYRVFNLRTKTIMESINVVVDDFADDSKKEEGIYLVDEAEDQLQKINVTPDVVMQDVEENKIEPSIATTSAMKDVTDIFDPTIRDPPTRIEKNHPTVNIIGEFTDGIQTRDKPKRNYQDMVKYVCYTSSIEPKNVKEALQDEY